MAFDLTPTPARTLPGYRVRRSSRAKHVNLKIHPIDGLIVVVPHGFDECLVPGIIREQLTWIEARLDQFARESSAGARWQRPGSVTLPAANEYWTIEYRTGRSDTVRLSMHDRVLRATGAVDDQEKLRKSFQRWLKRRAWHLLPDRLSELAGMHGFRFERVTIRLQRSRWGSYSSRGTISLNAKLMFLSPELVDHVLLHELCHTRHPDHGDAFQALIMKLIPHHHRQRVALHAAWAEMPAWAHR